MNQLHYKRALRNIRVFVSSTFVDMTHERNYLAKRVFPRITDYCERRDIKFTPVDLRWGITKEESEGNNVVGLCIDEIESSRPFFIGLAGWRYGWIPSRKDFGDRYDELCEKIPWLSDAVKRGTSITEIEYLYGALNYVSNNPEEKVDAAFFVKDDPDFKSDFQQRNLRDRLEKQTNYPVNKYSSLEELGDMVYVELVRFIELIFPPEEDGLVSDRARHTFFMLERAKEYIDVPGVNPSEILSDWLLSSKPYLCVYGETFIKNSKTIGWSRGKSMLLCRMAAELYASRKFDVVYFDMDVFNDRRSDSLDQLIEYMDSVTALSMEKPLVFVIDNIIAYYGRIDVILSLLQRLVKLGLVMFTGQTGGWIFRLGSDLVYETKGADLDSEGRGKLIARYMALHGKKLLPEQIKVLAEGHRDISDLISLLPMLVRFGSFDHLDEEVKRYAKGNPIEILIEELRSDVGNTHDGSWEPLWVLNAIALSEEGGLTEDEILGLTNMTMLRWSQIRQRITEICRRRGNLYVLEHYQRDRQSLINYYYTNYRDYILGRMRHWIAENGMAAWRLAIVIASVYDSFIGAAEDLSEEFNKEKQSFYTDVEIVNNLPAYYIIDFWRCHQYDNLQLERPWVLRKNQKTYSREELIKYYQKLLLCIGKRVNETLCRKFHARLVELKGINPDDSILFEIRMSIEKRRDISRAISFFYDSYFRKPEKRLEAIIMLMEASKNYFRMELHDFIELFEDEKNILPADDLIRCRGELLKLELEIMEIRYQVESSQEQKSLIKSYDIINRLEFFYNRFRSGGWESPEFALLQSLFGYVYTILGDYVLAQRRWFDNAVHCAIIIHSRSSFEYKKALFDYGMGFMNVDLPDLSISHINDSGILKEKAEVILNPWICIGLTEISEDKRYPLLMRKAAKEKLDEIDRIVD